MPRWRPARPIARPGQSLHPVRRTQRRLAIRRRRVRSDCSGGRPFTGRPLSSSASTRILHLQCLSRNESPYPQHFVGPSSNRTSSCGATLVRIRCSGRGASTMEWNEETIGRLRSLWDEGHSTAEIGRRLGITKNAVVGKAHRLSLPARPSPIRRSSGEGRAPRRPTPRRVNGPTLAPLMVASVPARAAEAPRPPPVLRAVATSPRPAGRVSACCWPIGEPGTVSFRFCSDAAMHGRPYCAEHAAIAYVKVRDRREDAA